MKHILVSRGHDCKRFSPSRRKNSSHQERLSRDRLPAAARTAGVRGVAVNVVDCRHVPGYRYNHPPLAGGDNGGRQKAKDER